MQVLYGTGQFEARAARTSAHSVWLAGPRWPGPPAPSATLGSYQMGAWWNGRHDGLKIHWPQGREGSSPSAPTRLSAQTPSSQAC